MDVDKAFLKGFTYKELAEATGEKERVVCFDYLQEVLKFYASSPVSMTSMNQFIAYNVSNLEPELKMRPELSL